VFFECRPAVAATEPIQADDDTRPVFEGVATQSPCSVAVGVGEHLVGDDDRDVVFSGQRQQLGYLTGDRAQRIATFDVLAALEAIKAGRAIEDDQLDALGELGGIPHGLLLFAEIHRIRDDQAGGDLLDWIIGGGIDQLPKAVDREPFGVDIQRAPTVGGDTDCRRERDVGFPRCWRAVQLGDRSALKTAAQQFVESPTAGRNWLAHSVCLPGCTKSDSVCRRGDVVLSTAGQPAAVIVVATDDFRLYHAAVTALRERGVTFTTIEPDDEMPSRASVLVTGVDDTVESRDPEIERVTATPDDIRPAIESALSILRDGEGRRIIGVDPGSRPGVAVLAGQRVISAFQVPLAEAVETISEECEGAADPLVRIGDGARLQGAQILNELDDVAVELVDETGTTPYLGAGARGMGDVLAAINIAQRSGEPIESREIEPTPGELQRIKNESRTQSNGSRTISQQLARRVATGKLTIEEALTIHRTSDDAVD